MTHFIVIFNLLLWLGTKPAMSSRCALLLLVKLCLFQIEYDKQLDLVQLAVHKGCMFHSGRAVVVTLWIG